MLTVRDHVIGLEASTFAADSRTGRMRRRAKQAERRFRKLRNQLDAVTTEIEEIAASRRPGPRLKQLAERLRTESREPSRRSPVEDDDQ